MNISESFNSTGPNIDARLGILSYDQYLKDLPVKKFTKMCMTEIINADMMIATFGEEKYYATSKEILLEGNTAYAQLGLDKIIFVYANTYKNFMAVANDEISDEDFTNLMKTFHQQYELATGQATALSGISRFIVAYGENLIDKIKSAYYIHRHSQTNFIISTNEREILIAETEKNLSLFELLNYAITNDTITPYYQGIYDNKTNKINKYEALMRLIDQDGNIISPGMFLDASKKFKLYLTLSKRMIDKALKEFENKTTELSINISLFDIESVEFKEWFLERIKQHPNPNKVIIEFVETENYNNNNSIVNFLNEAKKIGCRIAVDDFGVGFATYSSIISLKPDIIKIDGDIIKNLTNNDENKIILDSICYMAKLIDSQTVAEFVENEEIQKIVNQNNIDFSQGYYFSKPNHINNLDIF